MYSGGNPLPSSYLLSFINLCNMITFKKPLFSYNLTTFNYFYYSNVYIKDIQANFFAILKYELCKQDKVQNYIFSALWGFFPQYFLLKLLSIFTPVVCDINMLNSQKCGELENAKTFFGITYAVINECSYLFTYLYLFCCYQFPYILFVLYLYVFPL